MLAVITSVLSGSTAGLAVALIADHSLVAALASGTSVAIVALALLMRSQSAAWLAAAEAPLSEDEDATAGA